MKSNSILSKYRVSRTTLIIFATFIWTAVGCMLLAKGWGWKGTGYEWIVIILGFLFGLLKSVLFLDKSFICSITRIKEFPEDRAIITVFSGKTWMLIGLMIFFGITMRSLTSPCPAIGVLYVAIGWGMLFSSRYGWRALTGMGRNGRA